MPQIRSKKFSVFVAVFVLFVGIILGGFLVLKSKSGSASISRQISYLLNSEQSNKEQSDSDSDNDGLKDWEEKLYGTDPKNSDTDKDGYFDGEEVASGYDPAKKSPDDAMAGGNPKNPRPLPKNLTAALTKKIGQAIIQGQIKPRGNDTSLDAEALAEQAKLDETLKEAASRQLPEFSLAPISDSEINISDKIGRAEASSYLETMGNALPKLPAKEESEMEFFVNALENNDLDRLREFRQIYQKSYQGLKEISVPADLAALHKRFMAIFLATSNIYQALENIDQDPLKAAIALNQYSEIDRQINELIKSLFERVNRYNQ